MSENKQYFFSTVLSLTCSLLLLGAFSFVNNASEIEQLQKKVSKTTYLQSQDEMNKEMAQIMLPLLQKQKAQEEARSKLKKPDVIYVPEQLQNSKGY